MVVKDRLGGPSSDVCQILEPEQARLVEVLSRLERKMVATIDAAIGKAAEDVAAELAELRAEEPPPPREYFFAVVQQYAFCRTCDADWETFTGGNARIAGHVIHNNQNVAIHHWGANPSDLAPQTTSINDQGT